MARQLISPFSRPSARPAGAEQPERIELPEPVEPLEPVEPPEPVERIELPEPPELDDVSCAPAGDVGARQRARHLMECETQLGPAEVPTSPQTPTARANREHAPRSHEPDAYAATHLAADSSSAAASSPPARRASTRRQQTNPGVLLSAVTGGGFEREHLMPGEVIQQYELIRALGHGGMGSVYLARDVRLGRLVAIKFLAESSASVRARVMAEARTTAGFNHDNIVTMYEVGEHNDRPYLVLEYIAGRTLRQWWRENTEEGFDSRGNELRTPLSPQRVASVMVPVVRALACAHDGGVIHRDLKAENVMLADSGAVKVLDFGIAKSFEAKPPAHGGDGGDSGDNGASGDNIDNGPSRVPRALGHVHSGGIVGTLPYMSPEQLNSGEVDHRSDLWAAGIMMFEFALGQHPVPPSSLSFLYEIADLDEPMPSAARRDPRLGPLGAIIDRCLIKNRADRIDSAHTLLAELEALLPTRASSSSAAIDADRNPFAGLEPFQERDADNFFGRDRDIAALVTRVRSQPLVATVGPSGAGKSSLVRAGLVPMLERAVEGWTAHIIRPGRSPLSSLASLLSAVAHSTGGARANRAALGLDVGSGIDASASLQARLRAEPGAFGHGLRGWARRRLRRVLVFIDQFEELYTLGADADERAAFVACLAGAADDPSSPVRVVLSVREDFLGRMAEQREFMDLVSRGLMFVNPLDRAGLRQALTRPVEDADYAFEEAALVDDILDALADVTGALPLLQFAASALWQRRDRKRRLLTRAAYTAMGGIAGALAVHADTVLTTLPKVEREQVREIFLRLITPEHTRAPAELSELCALPGDPKLTEDLVARLVDARLLVIDNGADGAGRSVEIVHEALIHGWPTLASWLDETREDAVFRDRLRIAARQWDASRRSEGLLWRGDAAVEAARWQRRGQRALPAHEQAYLDAVLALMRRARRARKLALGGGFAVLAALLVAAVAALLVVSEAQREAVAQAALAEHSLSQERAAVQAAERARERAEDERKRAEDERKRAEDARRETADALELSRAASAREREARELAESALRARGQAIAELQRGLDRMRAAEAAALAAENQALATADRERALKDRYAAIIRRALGTELGRELLGARVELEDSQ